METIEAIKEYVTKSNSEINQRLDIMDKRLDALDNQAGFESLPTDRLPKILTKHLVNARSEIKSMNEEMTKEFVSVKKQLTQLTNVNKEMDERLKEMGERFQGQFSEMGSKIDALADLLRKE